MKDNAPRSPSFPSGSANKISIFKKRHQEIFSSDYLAAFWNPTFTLVAFQLSIALPFLISAVMIAMTGDTFALAVFGLALTGMSMIHSSILNSLTEILGVKVAQLFPKRQYQRMNAVLWKSIVCALLHVVLIYFITTKMYAILVAINIDDGIANSTTLFFYGSLKFLPMQGLNNTFVSYISSQGITKPLVYINVLSIVLVFFFSKYFILDLFMKEYGYIYTKIIQESISFVLYLYVIFKYLDRQAFKFPSLSDFTSELGSFFSVLFKTVMSNYADYIGFEVNTYMVALLHKVHDLALWCTFCNYLYIVYTVSCGFSNAFRMLIGHKLGERKFLKARTMTQHYFIYTAIFSLIVVILVLIFKYELGFLLTGDDVMSYKMADMLSLYCFTMFPAMGFTAIFSIHRLLRLDDFLMVVSTVVYPTLTIFFSWLFCYPFGWGVYGVALSFSFFKAFIFWLLLWNALTRVDWTKIPTDGLEEELMLGGH